MIDREFVDIVETWMILRTQRAGFTQKDMRDFIETMNAMTRKLISLTGKTSVADVEGFWSALSELATNAQTLLTPSAKIIADGIDRTNL